MRCLARIAPLLALLLLAGCTEEEPAAPEPSGQAGSNTASPALRTACPLLNVGEVATAFGGGEFQPEERPAEQRGGGTQFVCVYRSSTVDLVLTASDAPRDVESPQRFVSTLARTDPAAQPVPGLAEAATFVHVAGADVTVLLGAAKRSADRFRALTLALSTGDDASRKPLTTLARAALGRM